MAIFFAHTLTKTSDFECELIGSTQRSSLRSSISKKQEVAEGSPDYLPSN